MGDLEFDNVVFGYGGSFIRRLFRVVSGREHQLHCRPERLWEINACETCHGNGEADAGRVRVAGRDVSCWLLANERVFRRIGAAARGAHDDGARASGVRKVFHPVGRFSRLSGEDEERIDEALSLAGVPELRDRCCAACRAGSGSACAWLWCWRKTRRSCCLTNQRRHGCGGVF